MLKQANTRLACLAALALAAVCLMGAPELAEAGQGCPFEDGSCQEYCNQQGCNLGYCGHFAWIQCICRKCGDEWNWYDKVHYKPDKQVNQTELDSLKLNVSAPIILTSNEQQQQQLQLQKQPAKAPAAPTNKKAATLTTLLIPDLSDGSKLDLNDIPDENSEKFLDYLAKNHEKLAQATRKAPAGDEPADQEAEESGEQTGAAGADQEPEETVEIQISSSNNQPSARTPASGGDQGEPAEEERRPAAAAAAGSQVTRLLRMAVHERLADDLY